MQGLIGFHLCFDYFVILQPECCMAGAVANEPVAATCPFRTLIECLVGMEVSTVNQAEGLCISALHQSSGNFDTGTNILEFKYFPSLVPFSSCFSPRV